MNSFADTIVYILSFKWLMTAIRFTIIGARNFFSTRLMLKFMSVVLGTLLYFAISASHITTTSEYVAVRPHFTGVADGYELGTNTKVEPAQVLVKGRIAVLNRLQYLTTKPISLDGWSAQEEVLEGVEVDLINLPDIDKPVAKGQVTAEPGFVNVRVVLLSKWKESVITQVPIRFMAVPDYPHQVTIEPQKLDVHISAKQEILDNIEHNSVKLYIESSSMSTESEKEVIPEIVLPPGVRLRSPLTAVTVTQIGPLEPLEEVEIEE